MRKLLLIVVLISMLSTLHEANAQNTAVHPSGVSTAIYFDELPSLKDLPPVDQQYYIDNEGKSIMDGLEAKEEEEAPDYSYWQDSGPDPVWQKQNGWVGNSSKALIQNFTGQNSPYYPSDCNGTVGPNHFMQTVNTTFAVYDKAGTQVVAPTAMNSLFSGVTGSGNNDGDPLILYDEQAQKWVAVEFSITGSPDYMLIAVSQTSDPTGAWWRWSFVMNGLPDYEKMGIWQDGYYMGTNLGGAVPGDDVHVFERSVMIAGGASPQYVHFHNSYRPGGFHTIIPLDADGANAPSGAPGQFISFNDDAWGGSDEIRIFDCDVDWVTPANSTFTLAQQLAVAPFDSQFNAWGVGDIPQPGLAQLVDCQPYVFMSRGQYKNFGTTQSMVCVQTVDVDGTNHAGQRWYELEKTSQADLTWEVRQQGTYAPDIHSRFMGSIAINNNHEIALGYSISSSTKIPNIRYCGQTAYENSLASGIMDVYESPDMATGAASQPSYRRWGDYSLMTIDPLDNTTFWYTNEFYSAGKKTRVMSFTLDAPAIIAQFSASPTSLAPGGTTTFTDASYGPATLNSWNWSFPGGSPATATGQGPHVITYNTTGNYDASLIVTDVASGSALETKSAYIHVGVCQTIEIAVMTDNYGSETSWTLTDDATSATLLSGGSYGNNTLYTQSICLYDGCYTFTINDAFGDGICCAYGSGYYTITNVNTSVVYGSGGAFGYTEAVPFCVTIDPFNAWTGAVNNEWSNGGNWTYGHAPTPFEDVVLTTAGAQPIQLNASSTSCNNLTVDPGVNFEIYGYSLNVAGTLDNNGTIKFLDPAANLTSVGFSNIGGTIQMNNGMFDVSALTDNGVYGTWNISNGSAMLSHTTGFADLNATVNMTGGLLSITRVGSNSIWGYGAAANVTMSGGVLEFNCNGLDIVSSAYGMTENITGGTIRNNGYLTISNTNFTPTGGTIELFGPNDATINCIAGSIYNLNINKNAAKASGTLPEIWEDRNGNTQMMAPLANSAYPTSTLDIAGDLTITSGTFKPNGQTVNANNNVLVYGTLLMDNAADILNITSFLWYYPGSAGSFTNGVANIDYALWLDLGSAFITTTPNIINFNGSGGLYGIVGFEAATIATINFMNPASIGSMEECVNLSIDNLNILTNVATRSYGGSNITINNFSDDLGSSFTHTSTAKSPGLSLITTINPDYQIKGTDAIPTTVINNDAMIDGVFDVATASVTAHGKFETSVTGELIVSGGSLVCDVDIPSGGNILGGQTTFSSGSIEFPLASLTMYNSTVSGGNLIAGRSFITPAPGTFTPTGGTVEFLGAGPGHYIKVDYSLGNFFNDLTVSGGAAIMIYTGTPTRVNGNLLINTGSLLGVDNTISIGGNWTNNTGPFGFDAGTSTVIFNQNGGIQNVSGENVFNNVQQDLVGAGSNLQFLDPNTVMGNMIVNYFTFINDVFDVQGTLNLNNPASKFTANLGGSGTIAILDQGGTVVANGGDIDFLDLVESGVFGTVNVVNGTLNYIQDASQYPDINANITISGGVLNVSGGTPGGGNVWAYAGPTSITMSGGIFNLAGNGVNISTLNPFAENITGGLITFDQGFYASNPAFTPTGGTVRLIGGVDDYLGMDAVANFFNVEIDKSGGKSASFQYKDRDGNLINGIKANTSGLSSNVNIIGDLNINAGLFNIGSSLTANVSGNTNVNIGGKLSVNTGGKLAMESGSIINVNSGGIMEIFNATISRISAGYYAFNVNSGGTIAAESSIFEYMDWYGVYLLTGSLVNNDFSFNNCTFREGEAITSSSLMTLQGDHYFTANNVIFPANTWGSDKNIWKSNDAGGVMFMNATGPFAGATFEYDPYNRIGWSDGILNTQLTSMLEGPFDAGSGLMKTNLNAAGVIPLNQPFNTAPWNYSGTESVGAIPNPNVVDWVLIQARDAAVPANASVASVIASKAGFLLNNGSIVDLDGASPLQINAVFTKNLFVVVSHRNHLGILSNYPVLEAGGTFNYNFSNNSDMTYGGASGQKQIVPGLWGMFAGDGDANGTIGPLDKTAWLNEAASGGYLNADYNLDVQVDNKDKNDLLLNNAGESSQVPN